MARSNRSINPQSTQVLGKISAILRDDNMSFYNVRSDTAANSTIADDEVVTIVDDVASSIPDKCLLLVLCDDATYGRNCGIFYVASGVVYELVDTSTKYAAADTDTFICLYVSSGDLLLKNRSGAAIANDAIRIYRLS